jgi:hypothetical protein
LTAIDGLERFEAPAIWRPSEGAEPREVYVAIGEAELVILESGGAALAHWSLPALLRVNPGKIPALYRPDRDAKEELEVEELEMVATLDRLTRAVEMGRRRPGRLRRVATGLVLGASVGLAAMWLPGALRDHTANVVPPAARAQIGAQLLSEIAAVTGPPCVTPTGQEALETLAARLRPLRPLRLAVLPDLPRPALALPGDLILVSDATLTADDDPASAAGYVLAEALRSGSSAALHDLLDGLSLFDLARLLTSGDVARKALASHAETLLSEDAPPPEAARLRAGFAAARLDWAPFAAQTGLPADAEAPPMPPAMDDATWLALREICDD